jgi:hypothetical protein
LAKQEAKKIDASYQRFKESLEILEKCFGKKEGA